MSKESRRNIVEKFIKSEGIEFCKEAKRIFQYYELFGQENLFNIHDYLLILQDIKLTGLGNDEVDRLLNDILDDENGYYAYKTGLVKEVVDGVEVDQGQFDVLKRFLIFLNKEYSVK